jgi:glycosyltransferase involved in cell wall biosynthesis
VLEGTTGYRADGASVDAIAVALRALLSDEELSCTLGEHGRARVVAQMSWERVAGATRQLCRGF